MLVFEGKRFSVISKKIMTPHGERDYDVIDHPGAVVILPFLDKETILLIRNFRYALDKTLLELPAGTLEKGEEIDTCAKRELEEETGYRAKSMTPLFQFYASPGICNEVLYSFVAQDLEKFSQQLDEKEQIEVIPTPFQKAKELIYKGVICDAKTIATILYYSHN